MEEIGDGCLKPKHRLLPEPVEDAERDEDDEQSNDHVVVEDVDQDFDIGVGGCREEGEEDIHECNRHRHVERPGRLDQERLEGMAQEAANVADTVVVLHLLDQWFVAGLLHGADIIELVEPAHIGISLDPLGLDRYHIQEEYEEERSDRDKEVYDDRELQNGCAARESHDHHDDYDEERAGDKERHVAFGYELERGEESFLLEAGLFLVYANPGIEEGEHVSPALDNGYEILDELTQFLRWGRLLQMSERSDLIITEVVGVADNAPKLMRRLAIDA